jgi:YVTN family beta-propeller protein
MAGARQAGMPSGMHWKMNCVRFDGVLIRLIMKTNLPLELFAVVVAGASLFAALSVNAGDYQVFVSNEKAGTITVISGGDFKVTATIPVGKRPRGIHASPDGKIIYVALSGTPVEPPPELDASGNPILKKYSEGDDDQARADKSADGIGLVDVARKKFLRKIPAGSDPEQFCLSGDGARIYIANEDVGAATVLDAATGKVLTFVPVTREPEGVGVSPDGRYFYIGCETAGDVFGIDTATFKIIAHLQVHPRPRSIAFSPDGLRAFIPSESTGELNVIDTAQQKVMKVVTLPKGARPQGIRVSADGKKIYASTGRGGTVCVVDAATLEVLSSIKVGQRPWGIAISPDGKYLFAANGPSDDVSVVDLVAEKEIARVKSPGGPWGVEVVAQE